MRSGGFTASVPGAVEVLIVAVCELCELELPQATRRTAASVIASGLKKLSITVSLLLRKRRRFIAVLLFGPAAAR
jgi:hypothetical protein